LQDLGSVKTETEFRRQLMLRSNLNVSSFPSLVLEHDSVFTVIHHDYHNYRTSLTDIQKLLEHPAAYL
jgi:protein-disulfide isomerase-like protein with CxxC motif